MTDRTTDRSSDSHHADETSLPDRTAVAETEPTTEPYFSLLNTNLEKVKTHLSNARKASPRTANGNR